MNLNIGNIRVWGRGCPVDTSAEGRSTDRGCRQGRRINNVRSRAEEVVLSKIIYR